MKGLQWQVTLRNAPELYYNGRGATPEEALQDLRDGLVQGLRHSVDQSGVINRHIAKLEEAIESMKPEEPPVEEGVDAVEE